MLYALQIPKLSGSFGLAPHWIPPIAWVTVQAKGGATANAFC